MFPLTLESLSRTSHNTELSITFIHYKCKATCFLDAQTAGTVQGLFCALLRGAVPVPQTHKLLVQYEVCSVPYCVALSQYSIGRRRRVPYTANIAASECSKQDKLNNSSICYKASCLPNCEVRLLRLIMIYNCCCFVTFCSFTAVVAFSILVCGVCSVCVFGVGVVCV